MIFNSIPFLLFFPLVIAVYFLVPHRFQYIWLLISSYFFYMSAEPVSALFLILTTIITYTFGLAISSDKISSSKKPAALGICLALFFLLFFKYTNFLLSLFTTDKSLSLIIPLGISFYTFLSITYIVDLYRGEVKCERNILKYALFVSFFPCILAGPIERAKNMLPQLCENHSFDRTAAKEGLCLMLWGYFLKMVIVSRLTILTDYVFSDYNSFSGSMILVALICYTFLIYCDFAGYSGIAIGAAKILGFRVMDNFRQPYLSVSVADFWRRWHISLSSWFRDYLYIPLGGNRRGTVRKYVNVMIVFLLSGLWHGANVTFLVWGALNGLYQVIGAILSPVKSWLAHFAKLDRSSILDRVIKTSFTFILIAFTWIFFRASSISEAFSMIGIMINNFNAADLINGSVFSLGLGTFNFLFAMLALGILITADLICEFKNRKINTLLTNTPAVLRYIIYEGLFIMILFSTTLSTQEFLYQAF